MIELACRSCGGPFVPTRDDVLRGPAVYRHCSSCRGASIGPPAERPNDETRSARCGTPALPVLPRIHRPLSRPVTNTKESV
jgi:hypothetical protein